MRWCLFNSDAVANIFPHSEQMNFLTPSCRIRWFRSVISVLNSLPHSAHWNGVSVECVIKWLWRPWARTNDLPQKSHTYRRTFSCIFRCSVSDVWYLNILWHSPHLNRFKSVCFTRWRFSARRLSNSLLHLVHTSGLWPKCTRKCAASRSARRNLRSQWEQLKISFVRASVIRSFDLWFSWLPIGTESPLLISPSLASSSSAFSPLRFDETIRRSNISLNLLCDCSHCCWNDCQAQHLWMHSSHIVVGKPSDREILKTIGRLTR